jgi:hypothetical protein
MRCDGHDGVSRVVAFLLSLCQETFVTLVCSVCLCGFSETCHHGLIFQEETSGEVRSYAAFPASRSSKPTGFTR